MGCAFHLWSNEHMFVRLDLLDAEKPVGCGDLSVKSILSASIVNFSFKRQDEVTSCYLDECCGRRGSAGPRNCAILEPCRRSGAETQPQAIFLGALPNSNLRR